MASLGDILRGALGGEYSMGRDLDEEERRQIEELRAQGIYVPQERKMSPFSYGAGTVNKQNLGAMRAAMQPEQARRMNELMAARGEQERQRMAREKQNTAVQIAAENQARLAELERQQGSTFDPQSGQSYKDYLRDRLSKPQLSPAEQAELTVRQQQQLPVRKEEAAVATAEQGVAEGALKQPTIAAEQKDKQETLALAAKVRSLLSPESAKHMAQGTELGLQLQNKLLEAKLSVENSAAGRAIHQQAANNKEAQLRIDAAVIDRFNAWLQGGSEDAQRFLDLGGQRGLDIADQFNTMQARLLSASRSGGVGGLGGTLPPGFFGDRSRRPAGGRGVVAEYSVDEESQGQPRLSRPITNQTQPPVQPTAVPRPRGQRPMRQTQVPVAPALAPAQRGSTSAVNPWQAGAMQRAEAARREQATFGPLTPRVRNQINNLKKAIADKRRVIDFVESSGRRPFQGDLDDLAEAEAQLRTLLIENPQLLQD
jgi:hypothetical protein